LFRQLLQLTDRVIITYSGIEYVCDVNACGPEKFSFSLAQPSSDGSSAPAVGASGASESSSAVPSAESSKGNKLQQGEILVEVRPFVDGGLLVVFDGKSRTCYLSSNPPSGWKLTIDKKQHLL
jgi:hypothetical protein